MSIDADDEVMTEFRTESGEVLDEAEMGLLAVDRGEDFLKNYNSIFRAFHSIKGGAGMLGMDKLQKHVHHLETILEKTQELQRIESVVADYLLKGIDATRELLLGRSPEFEFIDPTTAAEPLPALPRSAHPARKNAPETKKPSAGRILLVDDEPTQALLLKEVVEDMGFEVQHFVKGADLLEKAGEKLPDVIISDLKMPGMDGMDLLKGIHALDPDLPVVLLSGHLNKETCIKGLANGAYAFIEKPFDPVELMNVVINAAKKYQTMKLINRSVRFMMYQFSDIDNFLQSQGKESIRRYINNELQTLLSQRRELRQLQLAA